MQFLRKFILYMAIPFIQQVHVFSIIHVTLKVADKSPEPDLSLEIKAQCLHKQQILGIECISLLVKL